MSDLHFDADGEPVKVPADAEELRVRRFRKPGERGACEVVHGPDGAPLYIPIDTTHLELRKLVDGVPGRYRLDPVDAGRRPCSGAVPMYVTIDPSRRGRASSEDQESVVTELLRANTEAMRASHETTRAVVGEFKAMAREITELVRVVTGVGRHDRPTPPKAPDDEDEDEEDEEDQETDEDEEQAPRNPLTDVAAQLVSQAQPLIKAWVAKMTAAAMAPAPVTSAPAPAAPAVDAAPPASSVPDVPPAPASPVTADAAPNTAAPTVEGLSGDPVAATSPTTDGAEVRNAAAAPHPTPVQVMHLMSINEKLTPQEQQLVLKVIERLDPAECARWMTELCALSIEDAVARVRSMMPPLRAKKEAAS